MKFFSRLSNGYRYVWCIISIILIYQFSWAQTPPPAKAVPKTEAEPAKENERYVSIDFNNVDVTVFIKFISELTGKNFIVDQRVKGKVTIISPSKISVDEAYAVFESVLEVNGFATVDSGDVIKIIPAPDARTKNIETLLREEAVSPEDKVITQLIPLKFADPEDIKRLFAPLISKNSVLLSYNPTNMLIITDVYSNVQRLIRILKIIDVVGVGQEISFIPLEYADAAKLVKTLSAVFQAKKPKKGATPAAGQVASAQFIADERTNLVIVVASEDEMERVKSLVKVLDKEMPKGKAKIHVYYLENAVADELAKVLQTLQTKQPVPSPASPGKKEAPVVSEKTFITPDKSTNSLIILADLDDYQVIEEIIKKLDSPRAMVYIECLIMEVNVEKGFALGIEWLAAGKTDYEGRDIGFGGGFSGTDGTPYSTVTGLMRQPIGTLPQGFSIGVFSQPLKIGDFVFPNLGAVIDAYKKDKNVNILSTPQLMTTDNQEASITIGKNVPYQTKSGVTGTTAETYNTYEYKDVGITLKITPQISKDRLIRLKIFQEVTKLDAVPATGAERPTTLKRTIDTTVIVNDNNTIAIGGLIDDSFSDTEYKIPCLGEVPGLGWLFKTMQRSRDKTNLFVFLTPHVIETTEEATKFYREKKELIDNFDIEGIKLYKKNSDENGTGQEPILIN